MKKWLKGGLIGGLTGILIAGVNLFFFFGYSLFNYSASIQSLMLPLGIIISIMLFLSAGS